MEFTGILEVVGRTPRSARVPLDPILANLDFARSAQLAGHDVLLAANGVGWNRAAAAVDAAASFRPDAIVSTGFCGALDPALNIADIVVGTSVGQDSIRQTDFQSAFFAATPTWRNCRSGPICSVDHVVQTSEEKSRLHSSGACAVEMEAAGVAERAHALGLPFHCVKAVTDLAGETMANDFNSALRSDGHFDTMLILRGSLHHPAVRLPELLRLRNRCVRAARALGDFFADCRF